ncbi:MATH domain and coiled-coil domain-containing protein At3g58250-like [Hibiscus syriacus]|uniref:MATH domain and coiled-coil domain-containing protein At3g58250-like n=1 Tax=Hibiscus syriacus TaxID=106335 RepID=UPI001922E107|nr:MATH domain and coiled-coil domain-containing protein At3g58250-like [Hibiscus syriacus]
MEVNRKRGSNLPKVIWRVEILNAVDDTLSQSDDVNGEITKVTWRIQNFSRIKGKKLYSEHFTVDGNKWRIVIYPKGNKVDHLSIYLDVADSATLPSGWLRFAQSGFAVINQIDRRNSLTRGY